MMAPLASKDSKTQTEEQYAKAFSIAKEALKYVSTFRTPPTPEAYEVWYRFVEGGNAAIKEQLSHAVNVAKSVSSSQLEQLREQFLGSSKNSEANQEVSEKLAQQVEGLQSLIRFQQGANVEFCGSIESANNSLRDDNITSEEFRSCLSNVLQSNEDMQQQLAAIDSKLDASKSQIDELRKSLMDSQKALLTDPLTGVGNRRHFDSMMLQAAQSRAVESHRYLLLVDMDNFKTINDTLGHAAGDEVLRYVASELQKLATQASISRYGGDEFAIVLTVSELTHAQQLADSICQFFYESKFKMKRTGEIVGKLTVSIGAAYLRPDDDVDSWFGRADTLLYNAKGAGRNRAMVERKLFDS